MRTRYLKVSSAVVLLAGMLLAGCVSQTQFENKLPDRPTPVDARRRAEVHTQLGAAYYSERQLNTALEEARMALRDDPTYTSAHNLMGLLQMELGDNEQARQAFEAGLALGVPDSDLLNNFGWFECQRGNPQRGLELLQRVQRDPLYATPHKVWLNAGVCQSRLGDTIGAEESLRRAISLQPNLAPALYTLTELTLARGAAREADSYFTRYLSLVAPSAAALLLGTRVARANSDRAQEQSFALQLKRRFPDSPEARALTQNP